MKQWFKRLQAHDIAYCVVMTAVLSAAMAMGWQVAMLVCRAAESIAQ